jgi:hypothetical protein
MSKDHWVSQFLLQSFAINGQVKAFNKSTGASFSASTKNICAEHDFTTFQQDQIPPGMDGSFLEKELSRWESIQASTLTKLTEKRSIEAISPEDFWELVRFAVWLYLCNPANRAMLRKGWTDLHIAKTKALKGYKLDELSLKSFGLLLPHAYLRSLLETAAAKEELLQSEFLGIVLKSAESSYNLVRDEYAWSLVDFKNFGSILCTSDRPVQLAAKTLQAPIGFGTPEATLFFPLSPDLCLTGRHVGKQKRFIEYSNIATNSDLAGMPKLLMWAKSDRFIIAANESALPPSGLQLPSYTPYSFQHKRRGWIAS